MDVAPQFWLPPRRSQPTPDAPPAPKLHIFIFATTPKPFPQLVVQMCMTGADEAETNERKRSQQHNRSGRNAS